MVKLYPVWPGSVKKEGLENQSIMISLNQIIISGFGSCTAKSAAKLAKKIA